MPLIGFTVFHNEVRDGTKRQTSGDTANDPSK